MDLCTRRLTRELRSLTLHPLTSPRIRAIPNESNILEWHYVIEGSSGTPYIGGHYHGKLVFPKEYPLKPPSVYMLTPSGRFEPNRRLCLSMSDFHPESWNPMWSVSTILTGLYSFMVETAPTLGSVETTTEMKRKYARFSLDFNVRNDNFCKLFPELVELQKENMRVRHEAAVLNGGSSGSNRNLPGFESQMTLNGNELIDGSEAAFLKRLMAAGAGIVALVTLILAIRTF